MGREIVTLHGVLADLEKIFRLPSVAAEQRNGEAEFLGLDGDERHVIVISRNENRIGSRALDRGELGFEILAAAVVVEFGNERAAVLCELLFEILREALGVVALGVGEDGRLLGIQ